MRTWQDTLKEDLETMGVDRSDVRDTASDRARWRVLETTRRPMFHLERQELSLSLRKLITIPSICHQASLEYPGSVD